VEGAMGVGAPSRRDLPAIGVDVCDVGPTHEYGPGVGGD
jgi:hypothetical protein